MTVQRSAVLSLALALVLGAPNVAVAAGGHEHGPKHGGQFVEVEDEQGIEMVTSADGITFHVTENDKPADLTGGSFKAVVQTGDGVKMYSLTVEGSTLKAKLAAALPAGAKVAVTGKDGHGHTLQARFVKK